MDGVNERVVQATLNAWGQTGKVNTLPVEGASMAPLILPGDRVEILHGAHDLAVGDVVGFRLSGRLVLHRVVATPQDGTVVTAGDNRTLVDSPVPVESVIGRVVALHTERSRASLETRRARWYGLLVARSWRLRRMRGVCRVGRWLRRSAARVLR